MQGTHESRQKVKHMAVATTSVFPRDTFPLLRLRHGVHVVRSYGPRSGGAFTVLTFKGASRYGATPGRLPDGRLRRLAPPERVHSRTHFL